MICMWIHVSHNNPMLQKHTMTNNRLAGRISAEQNIMCQCFWILIMLYFFTWRPALCDLKIHLHPSKWICSISCSMETVRWELLHNRVHSPAEPRGNGQVTVIRDPDCIIASICFLLLCRSLNRHPLPASKLKIELVGALLPFNNC